MELRTLIILFFLLFQNRILFSQRNDTSSVLFIEELNKCLLDRRIKTVSRLDIHFNQRWFFENETITFKIGSIKDNNNKPLDSLFGEIVDSNGNIIMREAITLGISSSGIISWKIPGDIHSGWYLIRVLPCSWILNEMKDSERLFFSLIPTKRFYIFNRKGLVSDYYISFSSGYRSYKRGFPFKMKIIASKIGTPIQIDGYIRNKNLDIVSEFKAITNNVYSAFVPEDTDPSDICIFLPDSSVQVYPMPPINNESVELNIFLKSNLLTYQLFSLESYSFTSGWFWVVVVINNKVISKQLLNENGKMASYACNIPIKKGKNDIIKIFVYKKGGYKVAEQTAL